MAYSCALDAEEGLTKMQNKNKEDERQCSADRAHYETLRTTLIKSFRNIKTRFGKQRTQRRYSGEKETEHNSEMSSMSKSTFKHERVYRRLLRSLLHPLGVPESTEGLCQDDLLDHLQEVFEINNDDHNFFMSKEIPYKHRNQQVNILVHEAKELLCDADQDMYEWYCCVEMYHPEKRRSRNISTSSSYTGSCNTSPQCKRVSRNMSPSHLSFASLPMNEGNKETLPSIDFQRTRSVKGSSNPSWNEEFTLTIDDYMTDEVHIYVCSEMIETDDQAKPKGRFNKFLRLFKSENQNQKKSPPIRQFKGIITIPVREIPSISSDKWYSILKISSKGKGKGQPIGECRITIGISYRKGSRLNSTSSNGSSASSTEATYEAYNQFLHNTYKHAQVDQVGDITVDVVSNNRLPEERYGTLSMKDERILKMFGEDYRISELSQKIMNVICLLEMQCGEKFTDEGDENLHTAISDLQETRRKSWESLHDIEVCDQTIPVTEEQMSSYRQVSAMYMSQKNEQIPDLPEFFPPSTSNLVVLKLRLGVIVQLIELDLWKCSAESQKEVHRSLSKKLEDDVCKYIDGELNSIEEKSVSPDQVIAEMERFIQLVDMVYSLCTTLPSLCQFYDSLGIDYYRVVSFAVQEKVSKMAERIMEKMNKYAKYNKNEPENTMVASKLSFRLYCSLRKLHSVIEENVSLRDMFGLSVSRYQDWFEESMAVWLGTFGTECRKRMAKAVELDKEVVLVATLVKYSNSSVDVLSIFAQMINEWKEIGFKDPNGALLGVTKITEIICDCARMYADQILNNLKRNGFYDNNLNADFNVTKKLCIVLNNIEHVRLYLKELPELLEWEMYMVRISDLYGNERIGARAAATLQRLVDTSSEEILQIISKLLRIICSKMSVNIHKHVDKFTTQDPMNISSVDQIMEYLCSNLRTLNDHMSCDISPELNEQLWTVILQTLDRKLQRGQVPEYYTQMKQNLSAIFPVFSQIGLDEKKLYSDIYNDIKVKLKLNTRNSEQLTLMYYKQIAVNMEHTTDHFGQISVRVACAEQAEDTITVIVTVLRGINLLEVASHFNKGWYIEVSMKPQCVSGLNTVKKTCVQQTRNPEFNATFCFPNIRKAICKVKGTCILFSLFNYHRFGSNSYVGEAVMSISALPEIKKRQSMSRIPVITLPLVHLMKPDSGPFNVLRQRIGSIGARKFISDTSYLKEQVRCLKTHPMGYAQ